MQYLDSQGRRVSIAREQVGGQEGKLEVLRPSVIPEGSEREEKRQRRVLGKGEVTRGQEGPDKR